MVSADRSLDALPIELVQAMFDHLPNAPFFLKDTELRFQAANTAMLKLCGLNRQEDIIGRTSRDFFGAPMPERAETLDREVMRSRRPSEQKLDVLLSRSGPIWLLFRRWPVIGPSGEAVGLASIARRLEAPDRRHPTYRRLAAAIIQMQASLSENTPLADLAVKAGVSLSQFERDFSTLFGVSPRQYLITLRIEAALTQLEGDASIADIAHDCGYGDQSAFARRFKAVLGMSPSQYRTTVLAVKKDRRDLSPHP